jgi:hypothetical protein
VTQRRRRKGRRRVGQSYRAKPGDLRDSGRGLNGPVLAAGGLRWVHDQEWSIVRDVKGEWWWHGVGVWDGPHVTPLQAAVCLAEHGGPEPGAVEPWGGPPQAGEVREPPWGV